MFKRGHVDIMFSKHDLYSTISIRGIIEAYPKLSRGFRRSSDIKKYFYIEKI